MADVGAIGYELVSTRPSLDAGAALTEQKGGASTPVGIKSTAIVADGDALALSGIPIRAERVSGDYAISGTVSEAGVLKAGRVVRVFRRDSGLLLGEAITDGSGAFTIPIIGYNGEVSVVAYDDTGTSPDYNAMIFDRVIPL